MLIVMVIGTSEVVISSTRPGLPKSASKYVAQIYGILDGRIWTVSLLPALKSSSKCFSATLLTVTAIKDRGKKSKMYSPFWGS